MALLPHLNPGTNDSLDLAPKFLSQRNSKDMFLAHMMFKLNKFDNLISTMGSVSDPRIVPLTRQIIISIMQDKRRNNLLRVFRVNLKIIDEDPTLSAETAASMILETCQNAIGQVYSYLDDEFNISLFDAVAPLVSYPAEEAEPESPEEETNV